ncbi:hypothetical protein BGX21_000684 [Mortierella sp. AD011]|nr:hypothetical protein BGX20_000790 [Mortierella sp. AD010]KAF9386927.1 hypothetical protein BGX21_000684 [Mortierella sp. AD011]
MFEHVIPGSDISEGYHNFKIYTGSEVFAMHEVIKNINFAFYQGDRCILQLTVSETEIKRIHYIVYGTDTVPLSLRSWESDTPIKITAFSISETEKYIAVLYIIDSNVYCRVHNLGLSKREGTNDTIREIDGFYLFPLKDITTSTECPELRIAINRDGTQIALFRSLSDASLKTVSAPTEKLDFDLLIYLIVRKPKKTNSVRISARMPRNTIGFGKFKTLLSDKEVFLYCDGHNLSVFIHRYKKWRMFHKIHLSRPIPTQLSPLTAMQNQQSVNTLLFAKEAIESAQGSVFAWLGDPRAVSIWSIEFEFITSFVPARNLPSAKDDNPVESFNQGLSSSKMMVRIAPHGRFMVIACGDQISKYLLPSATHVGTADITNCFESDCTILNISFLATGPKVLVVLQDHVKKSRLIATLEVESQQWSGEVALPFDSEELYTGVFSRIYDIHGPIIDIYPIDFSVPTLRDHNKHSACTETALNADAIFGNQEYSPKVGEKFQLKTRDLDVTTELALTYNNGERIRNWNFPKREDHRPSQDISRASTGFSGGSSIPNTINSQAFFLKAHSRFVLADAGYIQVWGLPEGDNGTCNLIAIVAEPKPTIESDFQYSTPSLSVCPHMQHLTVTFGRFVSETIDMLANLPNGHIHQHKIESQSILVQLYATAKGNNEYRQAILRYFTEAFAQCSTWDDSKDMFLYSLCENWETEGFEELLQHLVLGQHAFRWIPSFPKTDTNPIRLGIDKSRESPQRNIQFHKTLIKHCIRNATREGDTFFLMPILECMRLILGDRSLGLEVTRQLTFIPVLESSRNFVIENSVTGHSLSLKIPSINKKDQSALYKQDNPTLSLQNPQPLDPENKYFKDRLFVAPLSMLSEFRPRGRNDSRNILPEDYDNAWWTNDIEYRGLLYPPTLLDNPALEALIQHEW